MNRRIIYSAGSNTSLAIVLASISDTNNSDDDQSLVHVKWAMMPSHQPMWNQANLLLQAPRLLFDQTHAGPPD
jgi:hypothetical protein